MKKSKIIITLLVMITLIMVYFTPFKSFANDSYNLIFTADDGHNIKIEDGHLKVDEKYVDPKLASNINENARFSVEEDTTGSGGKFIMTIINGDEVVLNFNTADSYSLFASENEVKVNETVFNSETNIRVQNASQQQSQIGGPDNIEFDIAFTNTDVNVEMNNMVVMDDFDGGPKRVFSGNVDNIGETDSSKTNILKFSPPFGSKSVIKYTINNVDYEEGDENVQVEYNEDNLKIFTITVPGASKYIIRGVADESGVVPATIIWTNPDYEPKDASDAEWVSGFSIKNGMAKVIAVYDENDVLIDPSQYINIGENSDEYGLSNGFGWIKVLPEQRVVFEFVPDYGYQLTSIKLNDRIIDATGITNQFEIKILREAGNTHFSAEFTKIDDIVKAESSKIESGSIELGNSLTGGTAQLTVNDVELSSDKIKGFEGAAGDYTISNYLDIDLYQVFYKGKNDEDDVWSNKIDELTNEATIKIKLAEGVNADDIVLIHNVHDGEEYEIIEIESYDPETNTITFKTKSFSNYAIATKASATNKEKTNPKTGDIIAVFFAIFVVSMGGLITTQRMKKKVNISKH